MTLLFNLYSEPSEVDKKSESKLGHADAYYYSYYPMTFANFCKIILPNDGKFAEVVLSR